MKRTSIAGLGAGMTLVVLGLLATGCASILKGSDQKVSFNSEPSDAKVVITDVRQAKEVQVGSTPFTATLKRGAGYFKKAKYNVTFEKPGYQTEAIVLEGTPGGWYIGGNLLFGALPFAENALCRFLVAPEIGIRGARFESLQALAVLRRVKDSSVRARCAA